jgi:hypothetical protein
VLLRAHALRIEQYVAECHRLEAATRVPGWSFATYYLAHEGLALTYEQVGMLGAASDIYSALELRLDATRAR